MTPRSNIRTALRRSGTVVLLVALLSAPGVALTACAGGGGGGGNDEDAAALLERAFAKQVPSADLDLDVQLDVEGRADLQGPLRVAAEGPYIRGERSLPQLDLDMTIETQGAGQAIQSGLLSTGDRLFVKFGGAFYEQSPEQVARTNRRLARERGDGGSLSDLGLDASRWVVDARLDGEEEVGGVATRHVTGTLDVEAALNDVNRLAKRSGGALVDAGRAAQPLGERQIARLARSVEDPTFDVYIDGDDVVRRISLRIEVDVPERDRKEVGGVSGVSARLVAQLDDVGGDQRVEAPRSAQPLSVLTSQLGSLRSLGGGLGDGATGGGAPSAEPEAGAAAGDGFERYAECLDAADPDDADAIATCRALLP